MKFYFFSEYAELFDLAYYLSEIRKQEVVFRIGEKDYKTIGDGMIEKDDKWWNYLGKDYTFVVDGCEHGNLQDWLRSRGEKVCGGSEKGDKLENDRQLNQALFKKLGFDQPWSQNFKSLDETIAKVEELRGKMVLVLKQNGSAPKSINFVGSFEDSSDMLYHLQELKTKWNESQYGEFDCDLMEKVTGMEVAASAFFNGKNFLKNKDGDIAGFLNWEHKKESDNDLGETTGESGTLFYGTSTKNKLFSSIIKPQFERVLSRIGFHGVFDVNCIKTDDGRLVALEPTDRFGVPSTTYEFMEGLITPPETLLHAIAHGEDIPIEIHQGWGMVLYITSKPFPGETDSSEKSSIGERVWFLDKGKPIEGCTDDHKLHIHPYNVSFKDGIYKLATHDGHQVLVTGRGKTIKETRENLIQYIKDNIKIAGMKYRTDVGKKVEDQLSSLK